MREEGVAGIGGARVAEWEARILFKTKTRQWKGEIPLGTHDNFVQKLSGRPSFERKCLPDIGAEQLGDLVYATRCHSLCL